MERFIPELKRELKSEVLFSHISKILYSTDASMYQVEPLAVLIPRSKSELVRAIEITSTYQVPIIPRGAATNVTGSCLGKGLIIDMAKYINRIVEINYAERYAVVQPGVVLDHLNEVIAPHGLCIGPDTSTSNRATLGGMTATNACGAHSLKFGKMQNHVLEVELILWNGEVLRFGRLDKEQFKKKLTEHGTEGKIYRALERIRKEYTHDIKDTFPKLTRRASGYNLDELVHDDHLNVAALICGSEATFGIISEIKIALSPKQAHRVLVVLGFSDMLQALQHVEELVSFSPLALELIDSQIIHAGKNHPAMRSKLTWLEDSTVDALLVLEFEGNDPDALIKKSEEVIQRAKNWSHLSFARPVVDQMTQNNVWDLRKSGLGLLLSKRSYLRALAFVEDIAVPVTHIQKFISDFKDLLEKHHKEAGIYGHIGSGCIHLRPYFDLRKPQECAELQQLMNDVKALVKSFEGVLSGEHGDGLVRSWTTQEMFGPRIYQAFQKLKYAFDPYNLMNPGKIVGTEETEPQGLLENLRLSPVIPTKHISTYFDFSKEGGLELAVDMCNGNGQCRKKEGIMCPSFQVTHDEKDSTRARANLLRDFIHGKTTEKELNEEGFAKVLDLCIMCKGCKTECPSQVDMAKLKSEFLYHHHQKKKPSLRDWTFAHIGKLFSWGSHISWLVRAVQGSWLFRKLLTLQGVAANRSLPTLAPRCFSTLFKRTDSYKSSLHTKQVVLFVDTFTEFIHPEIGLSAVSVLEALEYKVIAPSWSCCGRTLLSKGYLPEAKAKLEVLVNSLYTYAKEGISIVGLEPSCLLTLVDEAKALHLDEEKVRTVANMSLLIDEFLARYADELVKLCEPYPGDVLVHGHCHQKALVGMTAQLALLRRIVTGHVSEIPSGCCGMAGAFGHETEHESFSKKIGELVLFPHIRQAKEGTLVITSGTSCRSQIVDGTGAEVLHPIELLAKQLKK